METTTWHRHRWAALAAVLLAVFMDMLDNQIVSVALPSIQRDLGAGGASLEWIAAGYTLAFALTLITGGRLGDRYGRKPIFVCGTGGFAAASLLAGLGPTVDVLIAARIGQGIFAGLMIPQVLSFVQAEFPPQERGKAFGLYGITFPIGGIAGPLLGGVLTQADLFGLGWRSIFLVNIPVGAVAAAGAWALMPGRKQHPRGPAVDGVGVVLLALPLLAVLYPLVQGWSAGWPAWTVVSILAAIPLGAIFVLQQRTRAARGQEPLLRLGLLRRRGFAGGMAVALLFFAAMGVFFVLTLRLQTGLGYSPMTTGLTFLPAAFGIITGNGAARALAPTLGRAVVPAGIAVNGLGTGGILLAMNLAGDGLTPWQLAGGMVVFGVGLGLVAGTLLDIALTEVPADEVGSASGMVNTTLQLATATGIAVLGTVFLGGTTAGQTSLHAATAALLVALGLLAAALPVSLLLPSRGHHTAPATTRVESSVTG